MIFGSTLDSRLYATRCELHRFSNPRIRTSDIMILIMESHHVQPSSHVRLINLRSKRLYLKTRIPKKGMGDLPFVRQALRFASVVNQCDDLRQKKKIRGCEKFIPNSQKLCTNSRNVGVVLGALFGPHSTKDVISIF